ncbi:distal tail protein Dit [Paenibacillus sp. NPDC057967]|uniref:distal tail protein Dit n=1 Tax=Paenibacillus sp. NPDC057967 TaxID=3346293 RepID=UPI0036DE291B
MDYGFTYKGRHCSELGVRLLRYTVNSPDLREYEDEPAGTPGVIDYGTELGKREIEITVDIVPDSRMFKRRQSEILSWLKPTTAAGMLVFDDVPDRFFTAKLSGNLTPEQIGKYGELRFAMKCTDPYSRSATLSDNVILDSTIVLDTEIRLDDTWSYRIDGTQTVEVNNWGYEDVTPTITITGSCANLSISAGDKTFVYSGTLNNETLIVDGERMTVKKGGSSTLQYSDVEFITLEPGINYVTIQGTPLSCDVSFSFRAKYL